MKLLDILKKVKIDCPSHLIDVEVEGITSRSEDVREGFVFVCLKGTRTDGHSYIRKALEQGACAIVIEDEKYIGYNTVITESTRKALSNMLDVFYGEPSKRLNFIAVTGTNGKTSVAEMIKCILVKSNISCEVIGTLDHLSFPKASNALQTHLTTPDPEEPTPEEPEEPIAGIKSSDCVSEITVINGKEYRALTQEAMGLIANAYYYSDKKGAEIYEVGTSGTPAKFFATKVFTLDDLPVGAVIWVNSGWQYRPEGWKHSGSRPGNVGTTYVTVTDAWWSSYTQRAFNISKTNGGSLVGTSADTIYENFKIYIPVENIID